MNIFDALADLRHVFENPQRQEIVFDAELCRDVGGALKEIEDTLKTVAVDATALRDELGRLRRENAVLRADNGRMRAEQAGDPPNVVPFIPRRSIPIGVPFSDGHDRPTGGAA